MDPIDFVIVGSGWRAEFFLRVAAVMPDRFRCLGVTSRDAGKRAALEATWEVSAYATPEEMLNATDPLYAISAVSWDANPDVIKRLAGGGMPVLSETPPAPDVDGLIDLYASVKGAKVQVAEQYHLRPMPAARLATIRDGTLGEVSQAQVSAAHGYHGISMIRKCLGVMYEPASISACAFACPVVAGPGREGPPAAERIIESEQHIARFQWDGKLGVLDFDGEQYFSGIRNNRYLIRGTRGEIIDDTVAYLEDFKTPVSLTYARQTTGDEGSLDGNHLVDIRLGARQVYRNPYAPARLSEEEIAIATCLDAMAASVRNGTDFYPMTEACQDHYLVLMYQQALKSGKTVQTQRMPWDQL